MFDDIMSKGVTRNYNTKPNESAHRPLKKYYKQTNYKGVEEQVCHSFLTVPSPYDPIRNFNARNSVLL